MEKEFDMKDHSAVMFELLNIERQEEEDSRGFWCKWGGKLRRSKICRQSALQNLATIFPILHWMSRYDIRRDLVSDVIAGLTVGTLAVPQSLGYAMMAGVAPIYGLYTSFVTPLIYSIMGTSRHVSVGVFALVCLMAGEVVTDVLGRQDARPFSLNVTGGEGFLALSGSQIVSTLAFTVGILQICLGVFGLGFLTVYLSDRVVQGFACGAAFHMLITPMKSILGVNLPKRRGMFTLPLALWDICLMLPHAHIPTCLVSLVCITALLIARVVNGNAKVMKVIRIPIPMELFVIVFGSTASYFMDLGGVYGVDTVRSVPVGLPTPQLPVFGLIPDIFADAFTIAVIGFSVAVSVGRLFAQKHGYAIQSNQELRALGVANFVGSFFQCVPAGVSLGRSGVQEAAGGVTQVVSIISASMILLVITVLGPCLEPAPSACLGCIVFIILSQMILRLRDVIPLWRISKLEVMIFLVPFVSIIILDVELGLAIGVLLSLFAGVVLRTQVPNIQVMTPALLKSEFDGDFQATSLPETVILRIGTPLYFANADLYVAKIRKVLRGVRAPVSRRKPTTEQQSMKSAKNILYRLLNGSPDVDNGFTIENPNSDHVALKLDQRPADPVFPPSSAKLVILDMVAVSFIDMTAVQSLEKLVRDCAVEDGSRVLFAACSDSVMEMLVTGGKCGDLPCDLFFKSVCGALSSRHDSTQ